MAEVEAILRSEILDAKICAACAAIDGIMLPADDPQWEGEMGYYLHPNCRAIWVPILDVGTMDFTDSGDLPAMITASGVTRLLKDFDDLPAAETGEDILEAGITVEEATMALAPYDLMTGLLNLGGL